MKAFSSTIFAVLVMTSISALAEQQNPPPIAPGPPSGSCCRSALGDEGASQQITLDGVTVWTCHLDGVAYQRSWESGRLPYSVLADRLAGRIGAWSAWYDRDRPSGAGDYELYKDLVDGGQLCSNPLAIECQTANGDTDWRDSGVVYHCDLARGGYCVNREQPAGGICENFRVRYLCPTIYLRNPDPEVVSTP